MNPDLNTPSPQPFSPPPTQESPSTPPVSPMPERKPSKKRLVIILIVMALIFVGAGVATIILLRSHDQPTSASQAAPTNTSAMSAIDTASVGSAYDSFAKNGITEFSADKKAATLQAFATLTNGFSLDESLYKNTSSLLIGLGIARGYLDHPDQKDGYRAATYLLCSPFLQSVPSGIKDQYFVSSKTSDAEAPQLLQKYSDNQLTKQVKQTLASSGVESDLAKALKLSGALAAYTPLVMKFDSMSSEQVAFSKEHYMFGATPTMWVESTSTTRYIVMTKNYAKEFMANPNGRERNRVIHELVHSQSPFVRGDLGRSIEERRAELFSGDKSEYYDAKQLFIYTEVFSGFSPYDGLQSTPTDSTAFYVQLYKQLGVEGANAFVTSAPAAFLGQPSDAMRLTQATFGGMDKAIQRAIAIGKQDIPAMNKRIETRVQKLQSVFTTKQRIIDDLDNNLDARYNMPSAAAAMKDYLSKH